MELKNKRTMPAKRLGYRFAQALLLVLIVIGLAACGRSKSEPTPAPPTRTPRPTFTPTPVQPQPAQAQPAAPQPVAAGGEQPAPTVAPPTEEPPTPTPEPEAKAVVNSPLINVRQGPGTTYPLAGQLERGTELTIVATNPERDWWKVCCVEGQEVWIADFLVDTSGPLADVQVAANIPPAPTPTPAPPTPTPAPAQPTPTPAPVFSINKGSYIEPRSSTNPLITFFGTLCQTVCPGGGAPSGGYKMVVDGPAGRLEVPFGDTLLYGDPGLDSQFIYNAKLEIPGAPAGQYRVWVEDAAGNQVSEAWEYTAEGNVRTFLPRWVKP